MAGKPVHYRGSYHVRARHVRQAAQANLSTRCWRCGKTLAEHEPHKNGKPAAWTAGHLRDGDPMSPLAPEASTCNFKAGRTMQAQATEPRSREW
jgi:hypothetical protein